jgi:ribose 5-phosphate isomerase A
MDQDTAKQLAAEAALLHLPESGVIGLGSGSTAAPFIVGVGKLVESGRKLLGVPTSKASRQLALACGIELLPEEGPWQVDVCVDGADEVSADLDLIKGGGGCMAREKVVNQASRTNLIIVDDSKLSERLGERWAVPVEVLGFAHRCTAAELAAFGTPSLRTGRDGPYRTDSGHLVYDLQVGPIDDPEHLDRQLVAIPGVVETGLFVGRADRVIVAGENGIRELVRR